MAVNINGIFQAFFNSKLGDDTAVLLGYSKFNPLLYLNIINLLFLLVFKVPIPVDVPLNIFNVRFKYRKLKLLAIFSVSFLTNIFLAVIAFLLINFYGINVEFLNLILNFNNKGLASAGVYYSGLNIVVASFLYVFFIYNIRMAVFNFVSKFLEFFLITNFKLDIDSFRYMAIFISIFIFTFFGIYLNYLIFGLVVFASNYIMAFKNFIINLLNI